ncbi:MAG TPA: PTS sugar transporter subunit IIA [Sedimentisphaerales bacterium]|jgi:PTS system fructose-specific IIC component/PTS system nitrogen regulatory IIA component|nr:PTS sugar transporter subunit IIA [Sedimentisphaerales bacterium]HNU28128.1 PTS sugar transporter subunit IIA [Sedimentisphaerales bacterium]
MALIDLVVPEVIKTPLESTDKPGVLRELVGILRDAGRIGDYDAVLAAVQEREYKQSTGLEQGIAVPHGKTPAVSSLQLAIGIAPQGIDFNSLDGQPTKLFFLLVGSPDQSGPHVQALADVARLARSKAFCRAVVAAENAQEIVELMQGS